MGDYSELRIEKRTIVTLELNDDYRIFLVTPWCGRDSEELARQVSATLARPPQEWDATWHPVKHTLSTPPTIAGRSWQRAQL